MIKETITYVDFNNVERTEDFWFHFSKAECIELEHSETGGLSAAMEKMAQTQDTVKIVKILKDILLKAYGEKDADGRAFVKSEEKSRWFSQTEAYSILYTRLASDPKACADFFAGIVPKVDAPAPVNTTN